MSRRIDYHHDPDAPAANSIVPSVNVAVTNEAAEILLIRRSDNDNWALPGGGVDLGESLAEAAVRETLEENGIECEVTGLSGIYTDPHHVILYTSNGEVRQEFSIVLTARAGQGVDGGGHHPDGGVPPSAAGCSRRASRVPGLLGLTPAEH
ncbi:MAG TPA: NUDIX domain-containing protein [Streptosporangiaceae bacterium]|nr:NUDIX domain-containing protein [Streptosporangiaceae bacterium]